MYAHTQYCRSGDNTVQGRKTLFDTRADKIFEQETKSICHQILLVIKKKATVFWGRCIVTLNSLLSSHLPPSISFHIYIYIYTSGLRRYLHMYRKRCQASVVNCWFTCSLLSGSGQYEYRRCRGKPCCAHL